MHLDGEFSLLCSLERIWTSFTWKDSLLREGKVGITHMKTNSVVQPSTYDRLQDLSPDSSPFESEYQQLLVWVVWIGRGKIAPGGS